MTQDPTSCDPSRIPFLPPSAAYALPLTDREVNALAYHEAGHAVAAVATGSGRLHSVGIDGGFGYHGRAMYAGLRKDFFPRLTACERGRAYLLAAAITTAAGPVAEARVHGTAAAWQGDEEDARDGYDPSEYGDFASVSSVARLLESSVGEVWAEAERFLDRPAVWEAVDAVALELLSLRERGEPAVMDAVGFGVVLGPRLAALEALAFTSIPEAIDAALHR